MPFPMTHTYVTSKIVGEEPMAVIGSTLPDISIVAGALDEEKIHDLGLEFLEYLKKENPEYAKLGIGFLLHGQTPAGLDYYSHLEYGGKRPGYTAVRCKQLLEDVKKIHSAELVLPDEQIAHSLIELALELYVAKNHPSAAKLLDGVLLKLTNRQLDEISGYVSDFFGGEVSRQNIVEFYKIFRPKNFMDLDSMVRIYPRLVSHAVANLPDKTLAGLVPDELVGAAAHDLEPIVRKILPKEALRNVMIKALNIVKPGYEEFLETSVKNMDAEIRRLGVL